MTLPGISQVLHLPVTDSTQTVARFLAEQGAPHGTLVWADRQTSGKGRLERKWKSAPGGLYISLILRPDFPPSRLAELSVRAAEAAALALSGLGGIETAVKPPNDVYALKNGRARKICGILAEASGDSRKTDWIVLGVGVNVNNKPALATATSLKSLTRKPWKAAEVLAGFMVEFQKSYKELNRT
ncbi:MAG: biotin--[acetyl-CoA-carboxylase] ligase [Elusimicrobia bacterium]|nr:biotin--[acetyl-CoA-carboxylase] ligase [Elusimicrobiota bacterium]